MSIEHIVLIGFALVFLSKSQVKAKAAVNVNGLVGDPTNWQHDQWARLYGIDLTIDGTHPQQSPYDVYGIGKTQAQWEKERKNANIE